MRQLLCVLLIMICAVAAHAEAVEMPGLSFEVPAGFSKLETTEPGLYTYQKASSAEGVLGYCLINDMGWNLPEATNALAASVGCQESGISTSYNIDGQPISYLYYSQDGHKVRMMIAASADYIYAIGYIGDDERTWNNIVWSIQAENLIGIGGYEIINTQEYVRIPLRGRSFRVYTEAGKIEADTAMNIWNELYYKNRHEGYDLTSVWFYDMRSAAESGLPYGQIMQDELSQEVEYHENH